MIFIESGNPNIGFWRIAQIVPQFNYFRNVPQDAGLGYTKSNQLFCHSQLFKGSHHLQIENGKKIYFQILRGEGGQNFQTYCSRFQGKYLKFKRTYSYLFDFMQKVKAYSSLEQAQYLSFTVSCVTQMFVPFICKHFLILQSDILPVNRI